MPPTPEPLDPDHVRPRVLLSALAVFAVVVGVVLGALTNADEWLAGWPAAGPSAAPREPGAGVSDGWRPRDATRPRRPAAGATWASSADAGVPGAASGGGPAVGAASPAAAEDPQVFAFRRSFAGGDAGVATPFLPLVHRGVVRSAHGHAAQVGDACTVRVLPVESGGFNCVMLVVCGGAVVYPDPAQVAGYVACEVEDGRATRAEDALPSVADSDPAVRFDVSGGRVSVRDEDATGEGFAVEIELTGAPRAWP